MDKNTMRLALIVSALAIVLSGPAVAQTDDQAGTQNVLATISTEPVAQARAGSVFEVPMVPVSAEAENASDAQAVARDMGRRRAMDILLRRLTAEEDWDYLPRLAAGNVAPAAEGPQPVEPDSGIGDGAGPPASEPALFERSYAGGKQPVMLDASQLPSMEQGFAVFDEKSSARTYSAKISYRFKAEEIRDLLKRSGIPYSESQTRMALIIPVLETQNGDYLWETNNPWARAWLARSLTNELTPMLLPRGDETDMEILPVGAALSFDQAALQQMAERYGVRQVLIAHAFLDEEDGQYRMRGRLLDGYLASSGRNAANYSADNASALYDDTAGFGSSGVLVRTSSDQPGRALFENFFRGEAGDFPVLAQRAVENMVSRYAAGWKAQTLVDHSVVRQVRMNVWVDSLDEFALIRRALEDSPIVESIETGPISLQGGSITVSVAGAMDQLVADLRQRNVILWTVDNIVWNVATPEKADEVRGRVRPVDGRAEGEFGGEFGEGMPGSELVEGAEDALGEFSAPSDRERRLRDGPRSLIGGDPQASDGAGTEDDAQDDAN
ncbi:DUF2066 domain-containing protein [Aquisalinus flavus]|uniref:DUF2066 domain-containing protein n=1 Tax=Aquisalinus flavus TaxID=1526572 RepID=A0A8J2V159_9PROT|nr:DUF2066 domain-containing protein [Aquisalinus flavus]MBD0427441.1 DUF2066 domain-containing protein [Aquisalinus flavus]GGD01048.1 hypothetical protein GCM10011342_07540 [Aquisalinus flavus]